MLPPICGYARSFQVKFFLLLKASKSAYGTNLFLLLGLDMFSCEPAIDIKQIYRRLYEGTREQEIELDYFILFFTFTLSKEGLLLATSQSNISVSYISEHWSCSS